METIHVVLASDENYARHTAVAVASLLFNTPRELPLKVTVVNNGITAASRDRLRETAAKFQAEIEFLDIDPAVLGDLRTNGHITAATYLRLFVPDAHPDVPEKFLYLDTDIVVRKDIRELWDTDIEGYDLAAVPNPQPFFKRKVWARIYRNLDLPEGEPHFNAGILLINAARWRERSIGRQVLEFARHNKEKCAFHDQDALNAILWGKWKPLEPKWNTQTMYFRCYYDFRERSNLTPAEVEAVRDPAIMHFAGRIKPWQYACAYPHTEEYYRYLEMTPWRGTRPSDRTPATFVKRNFWFFRRGVFDRFRP